MTLSGTDLSLPPAVNTELGPFPDGAYRANLYVYGDHGRIDWYALVPQSFLDGRFFTMGRGSDCNITLNDGAVSTRHGFITAEDGRLVFRDLQSTNGSSVNGTPCREAFLEHGDVIRVGGTDIRFLYSFRDSPVNLVLAFTGGPNAGKSVATYGASTSVGRLNCAINLPGAGIAPQHARIDAFGPELMFVVNLERDGHTILNDRSVIGIAPAQAGDRVQVGEHEMMLQIARPEQLDSAIPQGDGTLLLMGSGSSGLAPVVELSPEEAALLASAGEDDFDDQTVMDVEQLFMSPTGLAEAAPPITTADIPTFERPQTDARPARTHRGVWAAVIAATLAAGAVIGASLIQVDQSLALSGRLEAGTQTAVSSPQRVRVEQVYLKPGQRVEGGEVVANVLNLEIQAQIDRLSGQLNSLPVAAPAVAPEPVWVPRPVPPRITRAYRRAQSELSAAKGAAQAASVAFQRREIGRDALEASRGRELAARRALDIARNQLEAAKAARVKRQPTPPAKPVPDGRRQALEAELAALEGKARVPLLAPGAGVLVAASQTPRAGADFRPGEPVYWIASTHPLTLRVEVPADALAAVEAGGPLEIVGAGGEVVAAQLPAQRALADAEGRFFVTVKVPNAEDTLRRGTAATLKLQRPSISAWKALWR